MIKEFVKDIGSLKDKVTKNFNYYVELQNVNEEPKKLKEEIKRISKEIASNPIEIYINLRKKLLEKDYFLSEIKKLKLKIRIDNKKCYLVIIIQYENKEEEYLIELNTSKDIPSTEETKTTEEKDYFLSEIKKNS